MREERFTRVGNNLLYISAEERSHAAAIAACEEFDSHLVEFLTESEWQEVKKLHWVLGKSVSIRLTFLDHFCSQGFSPHNHELLDRPNRHIP